MIVAMLAQRLRLYLALLLICAAGVSFSWIGPASSQVPAEPPQMDPCVAPSQKVEEQPGLRYYPSLMEQAWLEAPFAGSICRMSERWQNTSRLWTNYALKAFRPQKRPPPTPADDEPAALSYFWKTEADNTRVVSYIEPLHGKARHPFTRLDCHPPPSSWPWPFGGKDTPFCEGETSTLEAKFDISYIITENACGESGPKPPTKFYDLGCTAPANIENFDYTAGSNYGPSIPLFFKMYQDRCLEFDVIYAWEATQIKNHTSWWAHWLSESLRARLHFYNMPVKEPRCPNSWKEAPPEQGSFLRFLLESAKPSDFVVLKVDIDGGPELEIVEALARRPELSRLVDELFFEYHFDFDGCNFGWGPGPWNGRNVDTALDLMFRLRKAGIRAHFWI